MTQILALGFDNPQTAAQARDHLRAIQHLTIDDAAVIAKESDGAVQIVHELDRGIKRSALRGSAIGLLVGGLIAPAAGLVLGGLIGAAVGRAQELGIAHAPIDRLAASLPVGESALVLRVSPGQHDQVLASLESFAGTPLVLEF